jgi:serine O-acetyltransferase
MGEISLEARTCEPFWENYRRDLFRHFVYVPNMGTLRKVRECVRVEGIWAMAVYRIGRALRTRGGPAILLWPLYCAWEIAVRLLTGIYLDIDATIGPGFYIGHHGSITVGPGVVIGENSSIGQMCWIGPARTGSAAPILGSLVYVGPGAKIFGGVTIGDRAVVGAGAVVLDDLEGGTTSVGNPARTISKVGSDDLIYLGEGEPLKTGFAVLPSRGG